ncbi:MAG: hypothetical protein ACW98Y_15125 [Candidatus Thorarchaeota archaeon]|jgi:hypothetical protein
MPQPNADESEEDFVERCIPIVLDEGTAETPEQAVAICHSIWDEAQEDESMEMRSREKFLYAPMREKSIDPDTGKNIVRYAFTSDKMDTGGDIITRAATEKATEEWRQWRNVRKQHDPGQPIGKAVGIGEKDGLDWNIMDVRIDDPSVLPLVLGDDPTLGGASVGIIVNQFDVNEDEEARERAGFWEPWIITDYTMIEISLVDHPANYDAKRVSDSAKDGERSRVLFMQRDLTPGKSEPQSPSPEREEVMPKEIKAPEEVLPVEEEKEKELDLDQETPEEVIEEKDVETEAEPVEDPEPVMETEVETEPEETKQEGGDPVLEKLSEIADLLGSLITMTTEGFSKFAVKDEEEQEAEVETEKEIEASTDESLTSTETESDEVQEDLVDLIRKAVKEEVNTMLDTKIEELKKLKNRKSIVVTPEEVEPSQEEKPKAKDPKDALTQYLRGS